LLFMARRRQRGHRGDGIIAPPPDPVPTGPAPARVRTDGLDDGFEDVPPEEANMPRWRRPSVQAARFAQPTRRQTVFESFEAEYRAALAPIPRLEDLVLPDPPATSAAQATAKPAPAKRPRRAAPSGAAVKPRRPAGARRSTSPGSA
jgi:hypothetical protein